MSSKTLLLCFVPKIPLDEADEHKVIEIVKHYGGIKRCSIFQRHLVLKAFIQPESDQAYTEILRKLSHKHFELGEMKIFPSNKQNVRRFRDSSNHKANSHQTGSKNADSVDFFPQDSSSSILKTSEQLIENRFLTDSNKLIQSSESVGLINPLSKTRLSAQKLNCKGLDAQDDFGAHIGLEFHNCKSKSHVEKVSTCQSDFTQVLPVSDILNRQEEEAQESIYVRVFVDTNNNISVKMIGNIFGAFGNIINVYKNKETNEFYLEFQKPSQAKFSCLILKNCPFFDTIISSMVITKCHFMTSVKSSFQKNVIENFQVNSVNHRYKTRSSVKINILSSVLHFSNVSPCCDLLVLFKLLNQIHEPVKIVKKTKLSTFECMYLAYFLSSKEAAEVLAVMHGKIINGITIKVSFSHPVN
jgi:hypothetical protein